jgi:hypothetical protein
MVRRQFLYRFLLEPLLEDPSAVEKPMFGCLAVYAHERLKVVLAEGDAPWNGLLVPTEHEFHAALRSEFPELVAHPVLKKWLYLREDQDCFERVAGALVNGMVRDDARFGVVPPRKKKKPRKTR